MNYSCYGSIGVLPRSKKNCKQTCDVWRGCEAFANFSGYQNRKNAECFKREVSVDPEKMQQLPDSSSILI